MLYVRRAKISNLGDSMNVNLLQRISGRTLPFIDQRHKVSDPVLIAIGSILQWADHNTIVWGSGFISGKSVIHVQPRQIHAVRGPLSRQRVLDLGFTCPEVYGDPALLYPRFFRPKPAKRYRLGLVAHYIDRHSALFDHLRSLPGVLDIHVKGPVDIVVDQMASCERIVSSSLHGIIVADAYGIPSTWVTITDKVIGAGFKFRDYFASVGRTDIEPLQVTIKTTLKDIEARFKPHTINIDLEALYQCCPIKS